MAVKEALDNYHNRAIVSSSGILLFADSRSKLKVILRGNSQLTQDMIALINKVVVTQRMHFAMDIGSNRHLWRRASKFPSSFQ
ncbi:hypothetical protein TNCV_2088131 [Trichonephila clavipes]|nr:hypothetical protein TNCV_2088131 [Trichonephila clavipes]